MDVLISASILSQDPLIIFTGNTSEAPFSCASILSEPLRNREVTFIMMVTWSADGTKYGKDFVSFVRKSQKIYPLHRYIVFCNTESEVAFFKRKGVRAFFGHHNSLVDPNIYKIEKNQKKDLVAIYNAVLVDWKRQHLCRDLKSVGFMYWNFDSDAQTCYEKLRQAIPQARFMNEELATPPHSGLSGAGVCDVLNRARVGLCLSAEEGGMHASIEYLLAGLPVVSTPSRGGRDFFFHDDFVEIAEPTPLGIAHAVDRVLARAPPAEEIRARTIALQQRQIHLFVAYLDGLIKAEGGSGFSRGQWDEQYSDKLLSWDSLETFLAKIPKASIPVGTTKGRTWLTRFRPFKS